MDFGHVLKRAWEIIWKFKVLWVFGILASCGQASSSGGGNSGVRFSSQDVSPQFNQYFNQLSPAAITTLIIIAIIVVIVLVILAILLGTIGRVGLIRGTMKAEQGAEKLTFGELWREGLTYFWRVFGLNLIIGLLVLAVVVIFAVLGVAFSVVTLGIGLLCFIPLLCLLVPLWWFISLIIEQANVALVVENLGIGAAIERGWQVVRENIGSMILMGLILILGVSLIGGAIISLPLLIVVAPAVAGAISGGTEALRNGLIASGLLFLVYLPILIVLSGILRAYTASAWTLTFQRLTNKPSPPLIEAPGVPENLETPPAQGI